MNKKVLGIIFFMIFVLSVAYILYFVADTTKLMKFCEERGMRLYRYVFLGEPHCLKETNVTPITTYKIEDLKEAKN